MSSARPVPGRPGNRPPGDPAMLVQVHTDNHIRGSEAFSRQVEAEVTTAVDRFASQITRLDVHLHDENSHKRGEAPFRCVIEARPAGHPSVATHHDAATIDDAVRGAADKLEKALDHTFGKLANRKGRTSFGGDQKL